MCDTSKRQAGPGIEFSPETIEASIAIATDILMDHFWGEARHLQLVAEDDGGFALTELEAREIATKTITALVQKATTAWKNY